jgi:enoyl-CoA hydratase/carnithine racemase
VSETSLLLREDREGCATLTLNRPDKLNALSIDLFLQLEEQVDALAGETETIGLVVLKGAGKCFSAGNDLSGIGDPRRAADPQLQSRTIAKLAQLPQPVLAAVHGHCIAGGLELALAADIILAAQSARFGDTHAKWGLTPIWGLSQRLPRRVGDAKAREMVFTCRRYSGEEALAMGLANGCVADEALNAEVERWSREMLAQSWHTHRAMKALFAETSGMALDEGLAWEIKHTRGRAPDAAERMGAFLRKG